ncbi:MAG: LCP family protein [bacterium]
MGLTEHRYSRHSDSPLCRLLRALFSAVIPGAGQITAGARRRGFVMLAVVVLLLICSVVIVLQGVDRILSYLVYPPVLLALLVINVALLAFRLFAVIDAYRTRRAGSWLANNLPSPRADAANEPTLRGGKNKRSTSRMVAAQVTLTLLLLLTVAPHAVAGYYTYVSHDLLTTVFVSEDDRQPSTTSLPPSITAPVSTVASTPTTAVTSTSQTTTSQAPPEAVPGLQWGEDQRFTILLVGSDAGYGRSGSRADSIMVATLDLETGRVALFGIPRNTGSVPLSEPAAKALGRKIYLNLMSSLYWDAQTYPELAPEGGDPGAVVLRDTVSMLVGIPIQHYAVVDMGGLVDLVDALGGITLNVRERVHVRLSPPTPDEEWRLYDILPGERHLDGHEALAFARSRTGTSDYDRMRRQRCVLMALLHQNGVAELAVKFPAVAKVIRDSLRTDIPIERLPDLIKVRAKLKTDDMLAVGFTPPDYITGRNDLGYNILDQELVQATVQEIIENPEQWLEAHAAKAESGESDCWSAD